MNFLKTLFLFPLLFSSCQKDEQTLNQRAVSTNSTSDDGQKNNQTVIFPDQELYFENENGFIYVPIGVFENPVLGHLKDLESLQIQGVEQKGFSFETVGSTSGLGVAAQKDIKVCLRNENLEKKFILLNSNSQVDLRLEDVFIEDNHTCVWTRVASGRFLLENLDEAENVSRTQALETDSSSQLSGVSPVVQSQKMSSLFEVKKEFSIGYVRFSGDKDILETVEFKEDEKTLHLDIQEKKNAYTFENGKICFKTQNKNIKTITMNTKNESLLLEGWREQDDLCVFLETLDATFILGPQRIDHFTVQKDRAQLTSIASLGPFLSGDHIRFYQENHCEATPFFEEFIQNDEDLLNFDIPYYATDEAIYVQVTNAQGGYSPCVEKRFNQSDSLPQDPLLNELLTPVVQEHAQGAVISSLNQPQFSIQNLTVGAQLIVYSSSHCQGKPWAFYPIQNSSMKWVTPPLEEGEHTLSLRQSHQGVLSPCRSSLKWTVDRQPPKLLELKIIDGQEVTAFTHVPLAAEVEGANQFKVSKDPLCETGLWKDVSTWLATFDIEKKNENNTLYFQWKDTAQNETDCYPLSVIHDDIPPQDPRFFIEQEWTNEPKIDLQFAAVSAAEMKISQTSDCSSGRWEPYQKVIKDYKILVSNQEVLLSVMYRDEAGNETSCLTDSVLHDDISPVAKTFQVSDEKQMTSSLFVDLELDALEAHEMYLTYTKGCLSGGVWEPYQISRKSWPLMQKNKENIFYAMFRDKVGNQSECLSLSVIHDDKSPTSPELKFVEGSRTSSETPLLEIQVFGASQMYLTSNKKCQKGGHWEAYQPKKKWKIFKKNKKNKVFAKFRDEAMNTSECVSAEVIHDNRKPKKSRLKIASGRKFVDTLTVTLSLRSQDAHDMYITNQPHCLKGGTWESYHKVKTGWVLEQSNAVATVYGMFRDQAGNSTKCLSDTILHDDTPPQPPQSFRDGDMTMSKSESPEMNWRKADDKGGSGIAYYEVAIGSAAGLYDVQDWTVPEKKRSTRTTFRSLNLPPGKRFYASLRAVDKAGNKSREVRGDGFLYRNISRPLEAGRQSTCGTSESGELFCWGQNTHGKLGHEDTQKKGHRAEDMKNLIQTRLGEGQKVRQISSFSGHHLCAILESGQLKCWGQNDSGQLGLGHSKHQGDDPEEMGNHLNTIDLQGDDVLQVIAGFSHTCALLGTGQVKCWGGYEYGQSGNHRVSSVGDQPRDMSRLDFVDLGEMSVVEIVGGRDHTCALSQSGDVKCWGRNHKGQLGLNDRKDRGAPNADNDMGSLLPFIDFGGHGPIQHLAAGYDHSCALFESGVIKCWGRNHKGQLGLGLKGRQGDRETRPVADLPVVDLGLHRTAVSIAAGGHTTCAVLDDQSLKCWGRNSHGQLGQGDHTARGGDGDEMGESLPPIDFSGGHVSHVTVGSHHVCAVVDGDIKCWGRNDKGQLGQNHQEDVGDDPSEMGVFLKTTSF